MGAENTGWVALREAELPELQRFLEANPEYWRRVMGTNTPPDAAREILEALPPTEWAWGRKWLVLSRDEAGAIVAMAEGIEGLFAPAVWHLGLFIVATRLHGTGASLAIYESLERWMESGGAEWVRLGVVVGNAPAERFWDRCGFAQVKRRYDVEVGTRLCDLLIMVKPLGGRSLREYLQIVERDRAE